MALSYLADRIPEDTAYTEKEFNEFLNTLHTFGDPVTLRRELYDYFLINKENDGTANSTTRCRWRNISKCAVSLVHRRA